MTALADRYQVVREVGEGATARVWLALDRQARRLVAVKQLHPGTPHAGRARLAREYRTLARLEHPNVVRVLELGEQDGSPFLVLEYVPGIDLAGWLLERPPLEAVVRVLAGVADALAAVHDEGLVHRDVKPDNVRVLPDGTPKLMDFGLAKPLEGSVGVTRAGALVGSVLYMSPEQCRGADIDGRADLYALGVMLYQALTDQPPFPVASVAEMLLAHLHRRPVPPAELNPDAPPALGALALALLEKDPHGRPASARVVRDALLASLAAPLPLEAEASSRPARADALLVAPLVGRNAELSVLLGLLDRASGPGSGLTAVVGDAGIGKTRLLRELEQRGRDAGLGFSWGAAMPDDPRPYGAAGRLVDGLAGGRRPALEALAEADRRELARLSPALGEAPPPDPDGGTRHRLFEAFVRLLEAAAPTRLLVLENLHYADPSTLELLAYAVRAAPDLRLIITYRPEDLPAGASLPPARRTLALEALGEEALEELIGYWLGGESEAALVQELLGRSGGNPWALEERLKAMLEAGAVARRAGVYEWDRRALDVPERLHEVLARRLAALPPAARELGAAASVLGRDFLYDDARALLEWDDGWALDALEALVRARIVREAPGTAGEGFRFTQPAYRELLAANLVGPRRRRFHSRAAAHLSGRAKPLVLAEHHLAAGDSAAALSAALAAGEAALAAFGYPQAERAFRIAIEAGMASGGQELRERELDLLRARLGLGHALAGGGRNDDALALWEGVISQAAGRPDAAEVAADARLALFELLYSRGHAEQAAALLADALPGSLRYAEARERLGFASALRQDWPGARQHCLEALRAARREGRPQVRAAALSTLAIVEAQQDRHGRAERLLRLAASVAQASGDARRLASVYSNLGVTLERQRRNDEALEAYDRSYEAARATAYLKQQAISQNNGASVLMRRGDFEAARARLALAKPALRRLGDSFYEAYVDLNLAWCAFALGELEAARAAFERLAAHEGEVGALAAAFAAKAALDLGDGPVRPPAQVGPDAGLSRLVLAQWRVSVGDAEGALDLARAPDDEWWWYLALVRLHARWQLGRDATAELAEIESVLDGQRPAPNLDPDLAVRYARLLRALAPAGAGLTPELEREARELGGSHIGPIVRDARAGAFPAALQSVLSR